MRPRTAFHNEKTFLYLNDTQEVPADKLVELDGYAFDADELVENAQQNLIKFYQNPHVTGYAENNCFSPASIDLLRMHPVLSHYAQTLDEMLAAQAAKISKETVDAVLVFLQELEQPGLVDNETPRAQFYEYFLTLSDGDKKNLNDYIISMNLTGGGVQALKFEAALAGGSEESQCIIITKLYLWQFIIDFRPVEMNKISAGTIAMMNRFHMLIQPREAYVLPPLPRVTPDRAYATFLRDLLTRQRGTINYYTEEEEKEDLTQPRGLFLRHRFFQNSENRNWEAWLHVMLITPEGINFRDANHTNISSIMNILIPNRSPFDFGAWLTARQLHSILTVGEDLVEGLNFADQILNALGPG